MSYQHCIDAEPDNRHTAPEEMRNLLSSVICRIEVRHLHRRRHLSSCLRGDEATRTLYCGPSHPARVHSLKL